MISKLVIGWRVYDATVFGVDETTGKPLDQPLLPMPATPELVAKLPVAISNRVAEAFKEAVNPPSAPAAPTTTTS